MTVASKDMTAEQMLSSAYHVHHQSTERAEALSEAAARVQENERVIQEGVGEWSNSALDDLKSCVELLSGGRDTVLIDDRGRPSVMVFVPAMLQSELDPSLPAEPHPVFYAGGKRLRGIYVSKFENIIADGRAYSLPMRNPAIAMSYDEAVAACQNKGPGWGLQPYGLWAALALQAYHNQTLPHGNNDHGADYFHPEEHGVLADQNSVLTGTGPVTWSHDRTLAGVWGMNGNRNEWTSGMRMMDCELQLIPGCDGMLLPEEESMWRAILPDGTLVAPGTPNTLKYGVGIGMVALTSDTPELTGIHAHCPFCDVLPPDGVPVPSIAKAYALFPTDPIGAYGGWRRMEHKPGDIRPVAGGAYGANKHAGVHMICFTHIRGTHYHLAGFRSAYADSSCEVNE